MRAGLDAQRVVEVARGLGIDRAEPAIAEIQAQAVMVLSLNQFQRVPSSRKYSSVPRPMAMRAMPR